MRLIRCCAPWFAALSFFVAAPSSADLIYQFNGVCDTYYNVTIGSTPEPVSCGTLADPSVQLTLTVDDKYPSVGFSACVGPPFTCLLHDFVWTDHADASGAQLFIEPFNIGSGCPLILFGVPPAFSITAEYPCGFNLDFATSPGGGAFFELSANDTYIPGVAHFVQGLTGTWTRIDVPIDEPTSLVLAGLALFPLAFVLRALASPRVTPSRVSRAPCAGY